MPQSLMNISASMPLSASELLINLGLGLLLSLLLRWHFQKFGSTISNRQAFSQIFPFVCLTTILIIAIVKSSLALSLGLVGALSIVRFRTPIKEPEELAYLFLSIAMGLGLGADQRVATFLGGLTIMAMMAGVKWTRRYNESAHLFLSVDWTAPAVSEKNLQSIQVVMRPFVRQLQLRRFDLRDQRLEATYMIDTETHESLAQMTQALQSGFPGIGVTVIDQNQLPTL